MRSLENGRKLKRLISFIVIVAVIATALILTGCASSETGKVEAEPDGGIEDTKTVDVDLTGLSATMVYSEVYNIFTAPDDYIGKTVKMEGIMASFHDDRTNKDYYACIIEDATACCAQGLEFELARGEYPKDGEIVTVVGVFDTYKEGEAMYCILRDAEILQNAD